MQVPRTFLAVIVARTPLASRWASERWDPVAVELLAAGGGDASRAQEVAAPEESRWRYAPFAAELHRSEAEGYHLNITAPEPKVFILSRPADDGQPPPLRPLLVTVSYNEAARMLDGGEVVDAVPMLPELLEWMRPFVIEHYKPEPRRKIRRNDPFAAGAGRRERDLPQ